MLAMARGEKSAAAPAAAAAAKAKEKPAAKPAAARRLRRLPRKRKRSQPRPQPLDTQSILAARKATKPGPMTKAEAAAKAAPIAPDAKKAKAKEAIVVPPMPVKPDYAKPAAVKSAKEAVAERRAFIFGMSALAVGFDRLRQPPLPGRSARCGSCSRISCASRPADSRLARPTSFRPARSKSDSSPQFGVWIVNAEYNGQQQIFALKSVCTHLGCTPNWLEAEQKFKCPCHGSGFYKDGINFEGPAPRPLERYAISIASDGEIEIDKSRTFFEEKGEWSESGQFHSCVMNRRGKPRR